MIPTLTLPPALSGEELYDAIMGRIEPDLTTDMLPILDELYVLETEEEHEERMQWYQRVFAQFDKEYTAFVNGAKNYYLNLQKKAKKAVRTVKENAEKISTRDIEDSIEHS